MKLPKPYFERDGIVIYHGDCLKILPKLKAGSVDAVVTDPPYGIARSNHGGFLESRGMIEGDASQAAGMFVLEWAEKEKLPTSIFASPRMPFPGRFRNLIVWDKGGAVSGGGDPLRCLKLDWELIQIARNGPISYRFGSVWRYPINQRDFEHHPTEKPVPLLVRLLDVVFQSERIICDPFMGSGTTLVACVRTGRKAIGIELDEKYCEIAAKRIEKEQRTPRLITPEKLHRRKKKKKRKGLFD